MIQLLNGVGSLLTSLPINFSEFHKLKKLKTLPSSVAFTRSAASKKNKLTVHHALKFITLYYPGSVKNVRLLLRSQSGRNGLLDNSDKSKILVKQSYVILVWVSYLSTGSLAVDKSLPGFFIYPTKSYKTTVTKAPMAHKTFSQEQYMVRYYSLSISFFTPLVNTPSALPISLGDHPLTSVNKSLYFLLFIITSLPYISTNLLILKRYSVSVYSSDTNYFSFYEFNTSNYK